jgi:Zn-dependent protease
MKKLKIIINPLIVLLAILLFTLNLGIVFINYLVAIILHELGHYFVAKNKGYKLNNLKLTPYGASISSESKILERKSEVIIAIAGPIVNAILIVVTICLWWLFPEIYY